LSRRDIPLKDLLNVAVDAAYLAGRRTLAHFNAEVAVESKADSTPVTIADREAERVIRERIGRYFPDHAILGEEQGATAGADADYRWYIDPIDGTKSFIHGVPMYGVLVAVEVRGRSSVGVVYLPATDEMVAAADGLGCTWNGRTARVSTLSRLDEATMNTSTITASLNRSDAYENLIRRVKLNRGWGDAYGYVLVATGRAEIMLDPVINPWDVAPMPVILREAGGRFTNWRGEETHLGPDGVATNGRLHEDVLAVLRAERRREAR
jgi:histidinol phosphatase-like enzyme (inositol monophosphatase family)